MSDSIGASVQRSTQEIPFDQWLPFLARFTRENRGPSTAFHFTHGVNGATVIRVLPATDRTGAALEVEAQDGTRTMLELTRPEEYALPPATP